jgi:hypothetical protein
MKSVQATMKTSFLDGPILGAGGADANLVQALSLPPVVEGLKCMAARQGIISGHVGMLVCIRES